MIPQLITLTGDRATGETEFGEDENFFGEIEPMNIWPFTKKSTLPDVPPMVASRPVLSAPSTLSPLVVGIGAFIAGGIAGYMINDFIHSRKRKPQIVTG